MNPRRGVPPLTRTEMTFLVTYATCTEAPFLVPRLKEEQIRQIMYFRTTPLLQIIPSEYLVRNYFTTIRENKQSVATKWQNTSYSRSSTVFWQFQWCTCPVAVCPAAKKNWGDFQKKIFMYEALWHVPSNRFPRKSLKKLIVPMLRNSTTLMLGWMKRQSCSIWGNNGSVAAFSIGALFMLRCCPAFDLTDV